MVVGDHVHREAAFPGIGVFNFIDAYGIPPYTVKH